MSFLSKITPHKIYLVIYNWVAWIYWRALRPFKAVYNAVNLPVYIFENQAKDLPGSISFIYAGYYSWTMEYWGNTVLGPGFQKRMLGRKYLWNIFSLTRKELKEINFLMIEHQSRLLEFFTRRQYFYLPHWSLTELDISLPMNKLFGRQRQDIERRIRQQDLSYVTSHEQKDFDHFYHRMYLPYTKARHADESVVFSYENLLKMFKRGELILVQKDNQIVGGGLAEYDKGFARYRALGIIDGNWEYARVGVISAVYYFLVTEMKKKGYTKLHLGGCRPLYSDGVTQYKISIGAEFLPETNEPGLCFIFNRDTDVFKNFLIKNPFIIYKRKRPHLAVFTEHDAALAEKDMLSVYKTAEHAGLSGIEVYCFHRRSASADHSRPMTENLTLTSADNLFLADTKI